MSFTPFAMMFATMAILGVLVMGCIVFAGSF